MDEYQRRPEEELGDTREVLDALDQEPVPDLWPQIVSRAEVIRSAN
jgi:hypothetical protein